MIILTCAAISSIAGFAFSALAGSLLFQVTTDRVYILEVMLIASIALQTYSIWRLRSAIRWKELVPYLAGGVLAVGPGIWLMLCTPVQVYCLSLGIFLVVYAVFILLRVPIQLQRDCLSGRILAGALGGLAGAIAAFPGAFVTIWCGAHGWDKDRQRAIYQPFILAMQLVTLAALVTVQPPQAIQMTALQFVLPALIGAYIGMRIYSGLSTPQFNRVAAGFLLFSGVALASRGAFQ
jgi:uncharacterized membrane protein YfcA